MLTRPPFVEQRDSTERILGTDQTKQPERLILFSGNEEFDAELRAAVREKWIAAWLYLRHLNDAVGGAANERVHADFILYSQFTNEALALSANARHRELRREIRDLLREERARRRGLGGDGHNE
jgi:hypothetical protein